MDELLDGAEELLDGAEELLDILDELLAISEELLAISDELLAISEELLAASEEAGIVISELAALDSAIVELAATDEVSGVGLPPVLAVTLLLLIAAELLLDEALTELLLLDEDDFTDDAVSADEFPLLLVECVELLPPPQAVNTTVRDKADRALSEYMLKFSIVYLAVLCPYPRAEIFIVGFKNAPIRTVFSHPVNQPIVA